MFPYMIQFCVFLYSRYKEHLISTKKKKKFMKYFRKENVCNKDYKDVQAPYGVIKASIFLIPYMSKVMVKIFCAIRATCSICFMINLTGNISSEYE